MNTSGLYKMFFSPDKNLFSHLKTSHYGRPCLFILLFILVLLFFISNAFLVCGSGFKINAHDVEQFSSFMSQ